MENGKHVAIEVPAATSLDEIWALVNTSEKTRKHCMMLENCVYDFFELNTLNMAQQGLFGEILHTEGSYIHNLKEFWGEYWNNWRLDFNKEHRGDVYPTHGLGPACQLLDIHRGDKINTLVAMDTKAVTGPELVKEATGSAPESFANGDHTMTMMRTENGKTIHIQHDVMNPRPYSRMYQLTGTKGLRINIRERDMLSNPSRWIQPLFLIMRTSICTDGSPMNSRRLSQRNIPILSSRRSARWLRTLAVMVAWTSSWTIVSFTVCATVCLSIWTYMTSQNGVRWHL